MNPLSACFLKVKIDNSLASNLSVTANRFFIRKLNNNLFSLLLKLILKKFSVLIILQLQSDGLICVSVNPINLHLLFYRHLLTSSCFESDLTLLANTVIVSSGIVLWKINNSISEVYIQAMHPYLPIWQIF